MLWKGFRIDFYLKKIGSSMILAENLSGFANPTGLYEANRQNHG